MSQKTSKRCVLSSTSDDEDNDYEGAYDIQKEKKTTPIHKANVIHYVTDFYGKRL